MARKANPALLGVFVLGAVALVVAALVVLGGGKFFRTTQPWVAYFDESIKGLSIGSPVLFRGVKVGAVTNIKVVFDRTRDQVRTPVFFELDADRITQLGGAQLFEHGRPQAEKLFEEGLRAQLDPQSLVTGQLGINLDFFPNTPIKLVAGPWNVPECPTIASTMASLGRGLQDLNTAELVKDAQDIAQGLANLVKGPELRDALVAANAALTSASKLVANADTKVTTLGAGLDRASSRANDTLEAAQALLKRLDGQTVTALNDTLKDAQQLVRRLDSQTVTALNDTLKDAQGLVRHVDGQTVPEVGETLKGAQGVLRHVDSETVPAVNQVLADLRPLLEEVRKAAVVGRGALERAEVTLGTVDSALDEQSPLRFEVRTTLQEVAAAARSFRGLSNAIERDPNSVIFGKNAR
jgi:paraquat-inducible protein B